MSLSRKTGLVIGFTLISLIAILSVLTRLLLLDSFSRLEEADTRQQVARASAVLVDNLAQLNSAVGDWSAWNDTYAFMLDGNAAYLEANIADSTFINLRLNLILFVSTTGQVVFGRGFEAQQQQAIPADLATRLLTHSALWHPTDITGNTVGIVALPQGVLLAASRPILTNEQTGPSHGTLLFGRWLDVAEIERLSSIAHVSMSVLPWDAPALPPDDQAAQAALSDQLPISVLPMDDQTIAGYTRVTDIDGQPALLLRVTVPRLIYAQGQSTLTYFALSLLAVGVVFSVLMPLLLERLVLSRLRKLNASVSAIEHSGDHIARAPAAGRDELANLGQAINAMLDTLQHSAETLRDSEQRYRLLFENMQTGFAYCQMIYDDHDHPDDFIYLDVNSAFEHLTGLKNVLGKKVTEVIPGIKELTPDLFEIYSRVARTGQPEKFELDFTPLAMWLSISVYSTAHGYFATVFDNITNRKQAEAAEREQRELAEALRDTAAALNSTLNFDEVLDRILISMERVLPFDAADILLLNDDRTTATVARHRSHHAPDHIAEITQWQVAVAQSRNLREMLDTGQPVIVDDAWADPGWVRNPLSAWIRSNLGLPIRVLGEPIGFLSVDKARERAFTLADAERLRAFADQVAIAIENARLYAKAQQYADELEQRVARRTRELTQTNAQLAAANERLTELDRLKSKFVSDVSHELRTPVTNLSLYVDLLDHGKPEKREFYIAQLGQQMARLRAMINEILDLARLERDQREVSLTPIDLNSIVEHVVATQQAVAEAAGLQLTCEVAGQTPLVTAQPEQLSRAVTNLVANAIKYTRAGSVQVTTLDDRVRAGVQVSDTGIGIAPEDLPHVFDRFYRGKQVAQSTIPGTGLGLAIVKEIIEAHGGTVEVASELGVGSIFRLWLPAVIG